MAEAFEEPVYSGNKKGLEKLKRDYGEYALKASTPELAPTVSYDGTPTIKATKEAVYEKFVSGLSKADQKQLDDVLPDVLFGDKSAEKAAKKLSNKEEEALEALVEKQGIEIGGGFARLSHEGLLQKLKTVANHVSKPIGPGFVGQVADGFAIFLDF